MKKNQKITFAILCALGCLVLALYIFPNLKGAENSEMLSIFAPDEYAQYPYVLHMLTPGATLFQSIHNFAVYQHYYYGYPFYFFSALAILPVRLALGAAWTGSTPLIVMVLREAINVLPMLLAILLLVWMQTKFKKRLKSILLFLFLALIPAVVDNYTWWHPDSLLVLFCVLTLFFLQWDDLKFGRNFYFSAVACGFAIGSKILGVLFFLTYIVYIGYGLISKRLTIWAALKKAVLFLLLMLATVVITNPLLLLPIERSEIVAVFKSNLGENTKGFWVSGGGLGPNWTLFSSYVTHYYGGWILLVAALIFAVVGVIQAKTRLISILVLSWAATYLGYFLFVASTLRPHYFLPILIPLFSFLALPISTAEKNGESKPKIRSILEWISIAFISILLILNGVNAVQAYESKLQEEETSPSIRFFDRVKIDFLSKLPVDQKFSFYRDWRAYVAPQPNWKLSMSWDLIEYEKIKAQGPDFLFLETVNIEFFSDIKKLDIALDAADMKNKYAFYSDAKKETITGYVLLESADFGKVFVRQDIYDKYFR